MRRMSDLPRRRFFRFRIRTLLLLTLLTVIGLSVYSYWSDYRDEALRRSRELLAPAPGTYCNVIFRGDLLGLERMSPKSYESGGVANYLHGKLVMTNDQWIVLALPDPGQSQRWIPRENVLMIEIAAP
jgi:hypothetical protein